MHFDGICTHFVCIFIGVKHICSSLNRTEERKMCVHVGVKKIRKWCGKPGKQPSKMVNYLQLKLAWCFAVQENTPRVDAQAHSILFLAQQNVFFLQFWNLWKQVFLTIHNFQTTSQYFMTYIIIIIELLTCWNCCSKYAGENDSALFFVSFNSMKCHVVGTKRFPVVKCEKLIQWIIDLEKFAAQCLSTTRPLEISYQLSWNLSWMSTKIFKVTAST